MPVQFDDGAAGRRQPVGLVARRILVDEVLDDVELLVDLEIGRASCRERGS
jgi:hypothetical protein